MSEKIVQLNEEVIKGQTKGDDSIDLIKKRRKKKGGSDTWIWM